eukprot:GILI01005807.1.p1 GENE.GILI01005807.1~~GILI01005807.1.p1  ORF type:complete len:656 (-),score=244.80 GILI01005807.1:176-2143(-)
MTKGNKSFKKFASQHLSTVIETRRKTAQSRKEMKERVVKKKEREIKTAKNEEKEHQDQLERLKETDPGFYSFLEDEDPTLLQFGQDDMELVEDGSGSDAETDVDDEDVGEEEEGKTVRITEAELAEVIKERKVASMLDIFLSAVRELGYKVKDSATPTTTRKFDDPELVKGALHRIAKRVGESLPSLLKNGSFKTHRAKIQIRRFLSALVSAANEGSNDPVMVAVLMQSLAPFVPVLHTLKGQTKSVLKMALNMCTAPEEVIRLASYTVVRAIATRAAGTRTMYQSTAFKGIFLALVRTANNYTIHTLPVIGFLMSSVVDLYGTDLEAAYQHTFVYTRQLAVYLRAALQQQSQANVRAVFNWQYLNALRTWGLVVSSYHEPAQLGPLIHPVVQVALGVMDLFASPRMFPMHLHILEMLNHISTRANGVYIPLTTYLLRILTSPALSLNASEKRGRDDKDEKDRVDLQFTMRIKKSQHKSMDYKTAVWRETLYLLTEHLATHSSTIGFPEAFWAVESTLRKLKKEVKLPKINGMITALLRHIETTSAKIKGKRDQVNFGPCDMVSVKMFEDDLKANGNALVSYHASLRQSRVIDFANKQKNLKSRKTIEDAQEKLEMRNTKNGSDNVKGGKQVRTEGKRKHRSAHGDYSDESDDEY